MPPRWETVYRRIPSGKRGTRRTLAAMRRLARDGAADPRVIAAAHDVLRGVPERDDHATMGALLGDVRRRLRYTPDPIDTELVKAPSVTLGESDASPEGKFVGDCDDASVLLSSFLGAVGIPSRFVVVAADAKRPDDWSHVYVVARSRDDEWVPLDPIVRDFAVGEAVPADRRFGPPEHFPGAMEGLRMHGVGCNNRLNGYGLGAMVKPGDPDYPTSRSTVAASGGGAWYDQIGQLLVDAGRGLVDARFGKKPAPAPTVARIPRVPKTTPPTPGFFQRVSPTTGLVETDPVKVGVTVVALGVVAFVAMKGAKRRRARRG